MRIPFEIPDVNETDEAKGFVYLEGDFLVFDIDILSWGIAKSDSKTVKAERGVINSIRLEPRWFKDRLYIGTKKVELLKEIPGPHVDEIELRTRKKHRSRVEAFIKSVWEWKIGQTA